MRNVILAMITTLNGRLDKPHEWVSSVSGELDIAFNQVYDTFDTMLIGNMTYAEMAGYWPTAENDESGPEINRRIAVKMNAYKKYVFTSAAEKQTLAWNNAEQVLAHSDDDIIQFITALKAQSGKDIYLAGGARMAQTLIRLGLVDEYRLHVYPVVSAGLTWSEALKDKRDLELSSSTVYDKSVVGLHYKPKTS